MTKTELICKELHRENLCTYFILSLLKLNKFKFIGEENFVDSYLSTDGLNIFVHLKNVDFFEAKEYALPNSDKILEDQTGNAYVKFAIPDKWFCDIRIFLQGKFSKMSTDAKDRIRKYSGLPYRVIVNGVKVTDIRLLALEKSKNARKFWEEYLDCHLDENQELLSIPNEKIFIDERRLINADFCCETKNSFKENIQDDWTKIKRDSKLAKGWV